MFIGGNSQGCIAALGAALAFPEAVGGFVGTSGHLLEETCIEHVSENYKIMPIWMSNGSSDETMQWSWVEHTFDRFEEFSGSKSTLCENVDHNISFEEGDWLTTSLAAHIPH